MRNVFRKFIAKPSLGIAALCLALLTGCSSGEQRDIAAFKQDTAAVASLAQINRSIAGTRSVSPEDFALLKTIQEKYPQVPEVRQTYRNALVLREDWATLESFFNEIPDEKLTPDDRRTLSKVYGKGGKYDQAVATLKPLADAEPTDVETRFQLATYYYFLDRPDDAAAALDTVWDKVVAERRSDIMTTRGLIYLRQNELSKAIDTLKAAIEIDPSNPGATNALGQAYARQGNAEQADAYRKRTAEINEQAAARTLESSRRVQQIYDLENAWKAKNYTKVIELANQLLPTERPERRMTLYQYLAESHKALGNVREAEAVLTEARKQQQN